MGAAIRGGFQSLRGQGFQQTQALATPVNVDKDGPGLLPFLQEGPPTPEWES